MKRVLVVEDEASIREMVALNLKMAGWEVVEAPSAERALELMHHGEECDAALLDIMLPGMDGLSLCETIRRENNEIGIIIVSAKGQESDKIRGLSIGADDYTPCVGERCQLWKYQRCGLFHESPDLYDIVEAVNDLTDAVEHMDKTIDRLQL